MNRAKEVYGLIAQLKNKSAVLFGNPTNVHSEKSALRIVSTPLLGPKLISYYPTDTKGTDYYEKADEFGWFDPDRAYRMERLQRLRDRGKALPRQPGDGKKKKK